MTYSISQTDPAAMTTEEKLAEIGGFVDLAEEVVARLSVLLRSLRKDRVSHPFFQHAVLRFYESIADQTLHPKAALLLANRDMIKAIVPLSHREQLEIAHGGDVAVAGNDKKVDHMPIHRMDGPTLKRVFGPDGIRSVQAQALIIQESGKIDRIGMITILKEENAIKVGNQKLTWEEIARAARQAGHRLILNQLGPDQADKAG